MTTIDLNSDMGESFGAYTMGDDMAMLRTVTTANVACGFHGGDPEVMASTMAAAKKNGVAVGAHPGFPDLWGFGRRRLPYTPAECVNFLAYQIGAAAGMAALVGHKLTHVKAHGAIANIAFEEIDIARAIASATKSVDPDLALIVIGGTPLEKAGIEAGLRVIYEIYADRAYDDKGVLVSRKIPGSVLHDVDVVTRRVVEMVSDGAVVSMSGKRIPTKIETICVHSDTPGAVEIGRSVRAGLERAGLQLKPFVAA